MKTIEFPAQQRLFDPFEGVIGPMGRKMIDNGWQGLFRQVLLEQMPVALIGEGLMAINSMSKSNIKKPKA